MRYSPGICAVMAIGVVAASLLAASEKLVAISRPAGSKTEMLTGIRKLDD